MAVGPGNQLASWIHTLFVMQLVMVRFPSSSSVAFRRFDHPTSRILKVKSVIRETIVLSWHSGQSWHVWCLFGTTSLPSEWRSISCGNQSGISWRGYTSFNATCPLRISCGFLSLVSPMCLLSCYSHFFCSSNGANFEGDRVSEGILRQWRFA